MLSREVVNKIIPIKTIIELADYLESIKDEYSKLFEIDEQKNKGLKHNEIKEQYTIKTANLDYGVQFKDGREITKNDYNWFIQNLNDSNHINGIWFWCDISYFYSNVEQNINSQYTKLRVALHFSEDTVSIEVSGKGCDDKVYNIHSYILNTLENNEDRYNKTVKHRKLRIQSFCFSIGIILSYIIFFIFKLNKFSLEIENYIDSKTIIILGQWLIAALVGNVIGYPIMMIFYRNILPKAKYSHYSRTYKRSVYVDNIEDYIAHNEVQIGKFTNNGKDREKIEKIYKITSKIVLVQIIISILLFFILK